MPRPLLLVLESLLEARPCSQRQYLRTGISACSCSAPRAVSCGCGRCDPELGAGGTKSAWIPWVHLQSPAEQGPAGTESQTLIQPALYEPLMLSSLRAWTRQLQLAPGLGILLYFLSLSQSSSSSPCRTWRIHCRALLAFLILQFRALERALQPLSSWWRLIPNSASSYWE